MSAHTWKLQQRSKEKDAHDKNAQYFQEILALKESEILLNTSLAGCLQPKERQEIEIQVGNLQKKLTSVEAEVQKSTSSELNPALNAI